MTHFYDMKMLKFVLPIGWGSLGIYRGIKLFDNKYQRDCKSHENNPKYCPKPKYFYYEYISYGVYGFFMYFFPVALIPIVMKEVYRLEVNIRNLDDEKKTDKYNELV